MLPGKKPALRERRVLEEIRSIPANPHPSYYVYVSEPNMAFGKVVLLGLANSAYVTDTFILYFAMGDCCPQSPPERRFITRVFHPNINLGGKISHSVAGRNFVVETTNKQILDTVFGLLVVPEFTDPIKTVVTLSFSWYGIAFREEVKKHIGDYARKGRKELGRELMGV